MRLSDFITMPAEIYVSEYTDENWERGYSNVENCLIVEDLSYDNYLMLNKNLIDDERNCYYIDNITEVAGYLRIYIDVKVASTDVRYLKVEE